MLSKRIVFLLIFALNPFLMVNSRTEVVVNGKIIVCTVCGKPACFISVVGNQVKALCSKCARHDSRKK